MLSPAATNLPSVLATLDEARGHVTVDDLGGLVMSDPGTGGYVAAYARVLADPRAIFEEDEEGRPLLGSFDLQESFLLSHSDAASSLVHRWFSILTGCIELLGGGARRMLSSSTMVGTLLRDLHALPEPSVFATVAPAIARDLEASGSTHEMRTVAALAVLLTTSLDDAGVEMRCNELERLDRFGENPFLDHGSPNFAFVEDPTFVWGTIEERETWEPLVRARFPRSPVRASEMRERLLAAQPARARRRR